MIELFIGRYLATAMNVEPPKMQEGPTCSMSAVFECETREKNESENTIDVWNISPRAESNGAYVVSVLNRLEKQGYIRNRDYISRREARKHLKKGGTVLAEISKYRKEHWFLIPREDNFINGHFVCLVGYIDGYYIVRNSWGEDGLNGYFLASDEIIGKIYDVKYKN